MGSGRPQRAMSLWCFVASTAVWFLTPLVFVPFGFWFGLEGFPRIREMEGEGEQEPQQTSCLCLKMLCAYISAVFWVYLYIPCMDIYLCFSSLGQYSMHFK